MSPGLRLLIWSTRACAAAAAAAGFLLLWRPAASSRRRWYGLALWVSLGAYAARIASIRFFASSGNDAYFIPLPMLGRVLLIEVGLACYLSDSVKRPVSLALLFIGLLLIAIAFPG
jgi:hypothetical protein